MKLISKDGAMVSVLFVTDEVRPLKAVYWPQVLAAIAERYAMARRPTFDEARAGGKFQTGQFRDITIVELGIFNDGLAVTTTDSDDSEAVLADLFAWLKETFGFREPITKPAYKYQSDLVIEFKNDPQAAFKAFAPLVEFVQKEAKSSPMGFCGMRFSADPIGVPGTPEFLFEPRVGSPSRMRYFCKANLRTKAHIQALELLDGLLA